MADTPAGDASAAASPEEMAGAETAECAAEPAETEEVFGGSQDGPDETSEASGEPQDEPDASREEQDEISEEPGEIAEEPDADAEDADTETEEAEMPSEDQDGNAALPEAEDATGSTAESDVESDADVAESGMEAEEPDVNTEEFDAEAEDPDIGSEAPEPTEAVPEPEAEEPVAAETLPETTEPAVEPKTTEPAAEPAATEAAVEPQSAEATVEPEPAKAVPEPAAEDAAAKPEAISPEAAGTAFSLKAPVYRSSVKAAKLDGQFVQKVTGPLRFFGYGTDAASESLSGIEVLRDGVRVAQPVELRRAALASGSGSGRTDDEKEKSRSVYTLPESLFGEEGVYSITFSGADGTGGQPASGNANRSFVFCVDRTKPALAAMRVKKIEEGAGVGKAGTRLETFFEVSDAGGVKSVMVKADDRIVSSVKKSRPENRVSGQVTVDCAGGASEIRIEMEDFAGNSRTERFAVGADGSLTTDDGKVIVSESGTGGAASGQSVRTARGVTFAGNRSAAPEAVSEAGAAAAEKSGRNRIPDRLSRVFGIAAAALFGVLVSVRFLHEKCTRKILKKF